MIIVLTNQYLQSKHLLGIVLSFNQSKDLKQRWLVCDSLSH